MDLGLDGAAVVVTGASRGIGLAIARRMLEEGARVVAAARREGEILRSEGAHVVAVDLAEADGPAALIARATEVLGGVDVLVNNVGGGDSDAATAEGFLATSDEHWRVVLELNLLSAVRATRAALPSLLERGGAVINVSSIGARVPSGGPIAYTTAKAALTAFSRAVADEFGPQGVRVNTVSPGPVRTALWEGPDGYGAQLADRLGIEHGALLEALPAQLGLTTGRLVEPYEVADLVAFLASPRTASIVGSDHRIDAGAVKTA